MTDRNDSERIQSIYYSALIGGMLLIGAACSFAWPNSLAEHAKMYACGVLAVLLLSGYRVVVRARGNHEDVVIVAAQDPRWLGRILRYIASVPAIPGRHPILFMVLYVLHPYYAYMWNRVGNVASVLLPCGLMLMGICVILRIEQLFGHPVETEDLYVIQTIGDLYRRYAAFLNVLFYVAFAVMFAHIFCASTMLQVTILRKGNLTICCDILILLALLRFWNEKSRRLTAVQCAILLTGGILEYRDGLMTLMILCVLIVAAEGISSRRILLIYLIMSVTIMTIAAWASVNGMAYYYYRNGTHAMGIAYRTDYATHWLYILMAYRLFRRRQMSPLEYILAGGVVYYIYHITRGRTFLLCAAMLLILSYLLDYLPARVRGVRIKKLLHMAGVAVYPVCALFSYATTLVIGRTISGFNTSEFMGTTMARLHFGYQAFQMYPLRLFSQSIYERGAGGPLANTSEYFFLDNSYVRMLIIYGIVFLLLILGIKIYMMHRCCVEQHYVLWCVLIIIAIHSISEHHMTDLFDNIVLVLAFAEWDLKRSIVEIYRSRIQIAIGEVHRT